MIVVDTNVWADYCNGKVTHHTDLLDDLLSWERILIGDLIIAKILQGFRSDSDFRTALRLIEGLECTPMLGRDVAIKSAENYRTLRSLGATVRKTIDVMIGTFDAESHLGRHHSIEAKRELRAGPRPLGNLRLAIERGRARCYTI